MKEGLDPAEVATLLELRKTGLLVVLEESAKSFTAPYFWYDPRAAIGHRTLGGGTMCFVRTPEALLGISAAHVHRQCLGALKDEPEATCQVGSHTFDPRRHVVDIDDELDIVTYAFSDIQLAGTHSHAHQPTRWPPAPDPEELILAAGWPWMMTKETESKSTHSFLHFIGRLNHVSSRNLGMATFRSSSVPLSTKALPPGTNLGGMSGGPIFAIRKNGLVPLELIGLTYRFDHSLEHIHARPISAVAPDGRVMA